jgi:hypothetical protein
MEGRTIWSTIKGIYINEGLTGYYKGVSAPLVSVPFINSIIFASLEITKKFIQIVKGSDDLTLAEIGFAGGVAGLFNTLVVTPIELVKCKMQMQKKMRKYKTSIECFVKQIMKNGIKGIYQGNSITLVREISGNAAQFYSYEACKRYIFGGQSLWLDYELRNSILKENVRKQQIGMD